MEWSIELDRGLRSRNHGSFKPSAPLSSSTISLAHLRSRLSSATRVHALDAASLHHHQLFASPAIPAPVAFAFGVLPEEARVFSETMLLRLAAEFRTADGALRASIVRCLLAAGGCGALAGAHVAEPDELFRKVKVVYDTGSARDRALALRMFGCLASIVKDSVHIRALILTSLGASTALEVRLALFICVLKEKRLSQNLTSVGPFKLPLGFFHFDSG
jgi:integrator complex subunit 7